MIENNLYNILDKEGEVVGLEKRFDGWENDELKFLKEWVGEKGKMYFCYMGYDCVDVWEVKDKSLEEVGAEIGVGDYNEVKIFENVVYSDDGFWVKVA